MFSSNTRILVVDDMLTMRKLVVRALREIGFSDFIEAPDGARAWEALAASEIPVGVVISDWNMPNFTGIELLKRVRADERFKELPFLLVTAESDVAQVKEALSCGVSGYVVKPFTVASLRDRLELSSKKARAG